ncbi:hypothetical protein BH23BAC1_BH23BAC1_48750 [soil metagenome]
MRNNIYTLITGASMGIGKAFAFECASRGMDLLLIALPEAVLEETKNLLKGKFPVEVITYGVDLTDPEAVKSLYNYCLQQEISVNILINNAGIGAGGRFEKISEQIYVKMLNLNIQAMTMMTYHFLPMLKTTTICIHFKYEQHGSNLAFTL